MRKLKKGDRVRMADALEGDKIAAYRSMVGTVTGFDWTNVLVQWDIDDVKFGPSSYDPDDIALAGAS